MEITGVVTIRHDGIKLDFIKPFEAHNIADFMLLPQGESTVVSWAMHGPKPYIAKLMHCSSTWTNWSAATSSAGWPT